MLGAGESLLLHLKVYTLGTNGELSINAFDGCLGDSRPDADGFALTITGTSTFTATGNYKMTIAGPFMDDVVILATAGSTSTNATFVEYEMWATVIPYGT